MRTSILLTAACLASVSALLAADRRDSSAGRVIAKIAASTCFVLVAVFLGASESSYGRYILGALTLGWFGDALLLSAAPTAFLAGLATFLLSHIVFAAAFAAGALSAPAMVVAAAIAGAVGVTVLRWLLPHTPKEFKVPVLVYVFVILAMCVAAAGFAFASQHWAVLVGAVLFAASDISVARDRFVQAGHVNRLWGWPTYFLAQLILAWTVAYGRGDA